MTTPAELVKMGETGKQDFAAGRYAAAAEAFRAVAEGYSKLGDSLNEAEQRNNLSVALLKVRRPQEALDQVEGTDGVFAAAGDIKRQGMSLNNRAAALQDLNRLDEALSSYERSAALLGDAGEGELRGVALKAAAALQLRRGRLRDSALNMLGALGSGVKPNFLERGLRSLLRRLP
jgi:tetratricopeptide (TPR) repeat protein